MESSRIFSSYNSLSFLSHVCLLCITFAQFLGRAPRIFVTKSVGTRAGFTITFLFTSREQEKSQFNRSQINVSTNYFPCAPPFSEFANAKFMMMLNSNIISKDYKVRCNRAGKKKCEICTFHYVFFFVGLLWSF